MLIDTLWKFETARFTVALEMHEDYDTDLSWDDTGEVADKLESGEYVAFTAKAVVYDIHANEVGRDVICGCIYDNASKFVVEHRDADPMNRNCSLMRDAKGSNVVICHYFPDMIRLACEAAREHYQYGKGLRAA